MSPAAPTSFEDKLTQYFSLFKGADISYSVRYQVKHLFDDLFHSHLLVVFGDKSSNKEGLWWYHDELLRNGAATVMDVQYKRIGYNKALVTFHMNSAERNTISRFLITIKDKKIIEVRYVTGKRSIMKARYHSDKHSLIRRCDEIQWTFPLTHQAKVGVIQ